MLLTSNLQYNFRQFRKTDTHVRVPRDFARSLPQLACQCIKVHSHNGLVELQQPVLYHTNKCFGY